MAAFLLVKTALSLFWAVCCVIPDWRSRRLPNICTLGGIAVATACAFGAGRDAGLASLVTGFFASAFLIVLFFVRAAGAGDVKMMFAAGVFAGPAMTMPLVFAVSTAGLLLAVGMLVVRKVDSRRLWHCCRCVFDPGYDRAAGRAALPPRDSEACRVPFAAAIAAGLLVVEAFQLLEAFS